MNILICDDAGFIRAIIKEALQEFDNLNLFEAKDGHQAVEMLTAMDFEVVILDMVLPQKNGLQVAQFARQHTADIFVVGMTSLDLNQYPALQTSEDLFNHWLEKPFTKAQLLEAVRPRLQLQNMDYQKVN